ncbi:type II methionyl aminopeptidase [Candidatus Thorarchaeota archaeon]|nr:MAG: type II methionyl aminopeptidase [Candidatus Thorarchaeota archaeon]
MEPHPDFIKAGKIAAEVMRHAIPHVKPEESVLKICELVEKQIVAYGGRPAFPCNVSINQEAAHYSSPYGDKRVFPGTGLVKVDIGAHVNGHLSDTAYTVDLDGSYDNYIFAARNALNAAIDAVKPGVKLGEIGSIIERVIKSHNLRPIHQLSGHQMKPWSLHAGKNVPNIGSKFTSKMKAGETYAIEPFATDGNGTIKAASEAYIYSNDMKNKKKTDRESRRVRDAARKAFGTLPWASRWLHGKLKGVDVDAAINNLTHLGILRAYPVLIEGQGGMVSQFEHTVFVGEEKTIVTTRRCNEIV